LLDGGISDNLGLRGAIDRAMVQEGPLRAVPGPFLEKTRRIAVIIVDAHVDKDYGWDSKERSPRVLDLVGAVARVQISRYSLETLEMFRETAPRLARDLVEASRRASGANGATRLTTYFVELHFNQLADDSDRRFFNSVPTRFQLPSPTIDRLRHLAATELAKNEDFRRLVGDLRIPSESEMSSVRHPSGQSPATESE
jgi:NTE family protein